MCILHTHFRDYLVNANQVQIQQNDGKYFLKIVTLRKLKWQNNSSTNIIGLVKSKKKRCLRICTSIMYFNKRVWTIGSQNFYILEFTKYILKVGWLILKYLSNQESKTNLNSNEKLYVKPSKVSVNIKLVVKLIRK